MSQCALCRLCPWAGGYVVGGPRQRLPAGGEPPATRLLVPLPCHAPRLGARGPRLVSSPWSRALPSPEACCPRRPRACRPHRQVLPPIVSRPGLLVLVRCPFTPHHTTVLPALPLYCCVFIVATRLDAAAFKPTTIGGNGRLWSRRRGAKSVGPPIAVHHVAPPCLSLPPPRVMAPVPRSCCARGPPV